MEVTFFLEEEALLLLAPNADRNENGILGAFDANRNRIHEVATKAYGGRKTHSYVLAAKDFS